MRIVLYLGAPVLEFHDECCAGIFAHHEGESGECSQRGFGHFLFNQQSDIGHLDFQLREREENESRATPVQYIACTVEAELHQCSTLHVQWKQSYTSAVHCMYSVSRATPVQYIACTVEFVHSHSKDTVDSPQTTPSRGLSEYWSPRELHDISPRPP